jgi:hypothetical protein
MADREKLEAAQILDEVIARLQRAHEPWKLEVMEMRIKRAKLEAE